MKKFISLVLALVMALSLTTVAWGANITGEATLKTALHTGGDYTLTAAVTLDEQVIVPAGTNVTINLNGQTLTLDYDANYPIVAKGNLTISGPGNVVVADYYGISTGYNSTGSVTINGGTYTASGCVYMFGCFGGTITINGGVFDGEYCVVNNFAPYYGVDGTVVINAGDFSVSDPNGYTVVALDDTDAVVADAITITGGTFNTDVSAYLDAGLTQTADGVVVSEGGAALTNTYDLVSTDISATKTVGVTVNTYAAKSPRDADKSGKIEADELGNVKYVEFSNMLGQAFVQVSSAGKADYTVYYTGTESVFGYFAKVASPSYWGNGVAFYNFGEACGQYDDTPVIGAQYYTFQGNLYMADPTYASTTNLMVGTTLTPVTLVAAADDANWVTHVAKFTYDKNYVITAVECAECGTPAVIYPNYASVPKAEIKAENVYGPINTDDYYCWLAGPGAVVDTETKVESAETFDAGIAMYVGMSVMAAAGSAVVIGKKKD